MKILRPLSAITAVFAFALVALSPIVRITGSGMGCGDDWPLCNGRIIPPFDNLEVMIEWGHRLAAVLVSVLVVAVAALAWLGRRETGIGGRGGVLTPAVLGVLLLVSQILLGAVTVWLELPTWVVVLHMSNALALLTAVLVVTFRAFSLGVPTPDRPASGRARRTALAALGLGGAALLLGALTANMNAGMACGGFPLCSGSFWPTGGGGGGGGGRLAHVHWVHRLVAYALFFQLAVVVVVWRRRGEPAGVQRAAWLALGVLVAHVVVAATMVIQLLPMPLRTAHAALGALVWTVLVYLVWASASGARGAAPHTRDATGQPWVEPS